MNGSVFASCGQIDLGPPTRDMVCQSPRTYNHRPPGHVSLPPETPLATLVYSPELATFDLGPNHPLKPVRYAHTVELMRSAGLFDAPGLQTVPPRPATQLEIERFHDSEYVDVVRAIGAGMIVPGMGQFGFGTGDNPPARGLYDAAALSSGSSIVATELVMSGASPAAFALAGGVHHHAMPARAAGFGVFNDAVIAIQGLVEDGLRVAYVDIDCHHGDGVQLGFYESDRVLTISIHESGQFLFPGTGYTDETGRGNGVGYSVNVPLAPYTGDAVWLEAFDAVVPPLVNKFGPDLVFTQLGIDTHFRDPITHLRLTTQGHNEAVRRLGELAASAGRWVAVGGGGYDPAAVARAWTMDLATMAAYELPERIPESYAAIPVPPSFADETPPELGPSVEEQTRAFAAESVRQIRENVFPVHGL